MPEDVTAPTAGDVAQLSDEEVGNLAEACADALVEDGMMIPFLGAAANLVAPLGSPLPPWDETALPIGSQLSSYLARQPVSARKYPGTDTSDLLRVAQWIVREGGVETLYGLLLRVFNREAWEPTPLHRLLARVAALDPPPASPRGRKPQPLIVLTTNYDDLVERAFRRQGVAHDVIWYWIGREKEISRGIHVGPDGKVKTSRTPAKELLRRIERPVVVKIHGSIETDGGPNTSFVVTEDDYIDYLAGPGIESFLPVSIRTRIENDQLLFLGYSLADWNLRVLLWRLWRQKRNDWKHFAIQHPLDAVTELAWRGRDVTLYHVELGRFTRALEQALDAKANVPKAR